MSLRFPSLGEGADKVTIDAETSVISLNEELNFEAPQDANGDNVFDVQVRVEDAGGNVTEASLTIAITDVNEPQVITSDDSFFLQENQAAVGVIVAVDDKPGVTFAITGGVDAGLFDLDATTGALTFISSPDFEAPGDAGADNIHDLQITATDIGGLTDIQSLTVEVTDANDAPIITSGAIFVAAENQTIAGAVTASDDQVGVTFSITGGADANLFAINVSIGVLRFKTAPNFEAPTDTGADNIYDVELTVTDGGGLKDTQAATVTVFDVNDAPVAAPLAVIGDEDTGINGTLAVADEDGDALAFSLNSAPTNGVATVTANGAFTFIPNADFNGTDSFTFRVSDGELTDVETVQITVDPVDEPVDPGDAIDPIDPGDPADPGDPDDPADPGVPFDPAAPPAVPSGPSQGDDTLFGTAQNDTINALAGNDLVNGLN